MSSLGLHFPICGVCVCVCAHAGGGIKSWFLRSLPNEIRFGLGLWPGSVCFLVGEGKLQELTRLSSFWADLGVGGIEGRPANPPCLCLPIRLPHNGFGEIKKCPIQSLAYSTCWKLELRLSAWKDGWRVSSGAKY